MTLRRPAALFISSAVLAGLPSYVAAQTLEIAPVTIDLPAGRVTSIVRVTNRSDQSTTIQMRPFAWTQARGEDKLEPTADLMLSPPFSTLNPGDTQTIRVVLRRPASAQEGAYRLLIDQLPSIADPGSVRVALRVSLPVFAAPVGAGRAALTWTLVGSDAVKRTLVVRNTGARHAKLLSLAISGSATAPGFTFRYVLAGSEAVIPVEAGPRGWNTLGGSVHISSSTDEGKVEADATISPAS